MKLYVRSGIIVILILSLKMILTTNSCSTINVNACTKVIKAVQRHFNSACVIIIQNDGEGFLAHMKFLAASQLIYSTIFLNNIMTTNLRKLQCHFKEPLYILPSSDDQTKKLLEKLSAEEYLSSGKWLLFLNSAKIEEFFISIHVPFDCEFLVAQFSDAAELSLTEVYRTRADLPLHSLRIAEENAGRELMWSNVSFIQRRGNLEELLIRGSVVEHVLLYRIKKSNDSKSFQAEGFINDIWNELQRRMNFRTNYSFPEDKAFGSFQNGSWTGVIGMIAKREADVGLSTFSFTRERIEVVDFFPPIWNFRQRVYIKEIGIEEGNPSKIFSTFSSTMWGATAVTMLGLTLVLAAVLKVAEADLTQQHLRIRDTWFYVFVIFCQQGQHGMPRSWSCRIVYMTSYFTAILLFVSFSAIFISFLTVRKEVVPFTDFQDLINDGTYKIGVLARSAHQDYFQNSNNDLLIKVYKKLIEPNLANLPQSDNGGLLRICHERKYGFVITDLAAYILSQQIPCKIMGIQKAYYTTTLSLIMSKTLPFRRLFNYHLNEMIRTGVLARMDSNSFPKRPKETPDALPVSISLKTVTFTFGFLVVGILLSILILVLEIVVMKRGCHNNKF